MVLDLSHNKIGNVGCEAICEHLKSNTYLEYLDISFNFIEDRGLYYMSEVL